MNVIRIIVREGMGDVPVSGIWANFETPDAEVFDEFGELVMPSTQYTCVEGEHFPPAQHGSMWRLIMAAKHKEDK